MDEAEDLEEWLPFAFFAAVVTDRLMRKAAVVI
jgi:hypothetical protein